MGSPRQLEEREASGERDGREGGGEREKGEEEKEESCFEEGGVTVATGRERGFRRK